MLRGTFRAAGGRGSRGDRGDREDRGDDAAEVFRRPGHQLGDRDAEGAGEGQPERGLFEARLADMEAVLSLHTGQSAQTLRADTDRDRVLNAQAALDYGLVDQILTSR